MHAPGFQCCHDLRAAGFKEVGPEEQFRCNRVTDVYPPDPCIRPNEGDLTCPPDCPPYRRNDLMPSAGDPSLESDAVFRYNKVRDIPPPNTNFITNETICPSANRVAENPIEFVSKYQRYQQPQVQYKDQPILKEQETVQETTRQNSENQTQNFGKSKSQKRQKYKRNEEELRQYNNIVKGVRFQQVKNPCDQFIWKEKQQENFSTMATMGSEKDFGNFTSQKEDNNTEHVCASARTLLGRLNKGYPPDAKCPCAPNYVLSSDMEEREGGTVAPLNSYILGQGGYPAQWKNNEAKFTQPSLACKYRYCDSDYICKPVFHRKYLEDCPEQDGPPVDSYTFL